MQKITTPQRALIQRHFLALFALLVAGLAWAGPEDDALAASLGKDYAAVLKIVKPPAIKGEAWAQSWLADAYRMGRGVVLDDAEAVKWYRLAAQQGEVSAQSNLGVLYDNGQGVAQDYAEAGNWYRLAAQQGYAPAQNNLGLMYEKGRGVVQDYVKAHSWFNLGAAKGYAEAAKNRDIVAKRMTPQQIADAQKLARDCQARQFKGCD
jgi:TPR repeat protein